LRTTTAADRLPQATTAPLGWAFPCAAGEQHKIADAIVAHLEQSNWKIGHGPAAEGHGPHLMPK
jgi:hypothetical protein